ncbi:replication-associated recombination protein A [Ktedonospora formicarum]
MRPRTLDEIVGQEHLLGPDKLLRRTIEAGRVTSMLFWGPPGSGKTTLSEAIARHTDARFVTLSAVSAGVADLRRIADEAAKLRQFSRRRTILFIDEIHRFNKAQQDAILPHVERGTVTLIGATTENPSFEVNGALLSRCRVFVLQALEEKQIIRLLNRALEDSERGLGQHHLTADEDALQAIAIYANGDARTALNVLELTAQGALSSNDATTRHITLALVEEVMQHRALLYDKAGDQHYDTISALHKAVRGSDPDGSLYWLVRMLEAGEDPLYIARRIVRMAAEDIGLADPQALALCVAAQQATHFIGMPEAGVVLAEAVTYLAAAPKSNAVYNAYSQVRAEVINGPTDPVPLWIRNAPTTLMKNLGYGKDYKYAHDVYKDMESEDPERPPVLKVQEYLPERLADQRFYEPGNQGKEASIKRWLAQRRDPEQDES